MPRKVVPQSEFHRLARGGQARGAAVLRPSATVLRSGNGTSRTVSWLMSDGSVDRYGDTIAPEGWDLTAYRASPVVLFAHDANSPPIGRAKNVRVQSGRLLGDVEFADADTYEFGDTIFKLVAGGFLKAGSVGFLPIEWRWSTDKSRPDGIDFTKQELLEFSIVPVPALPSALTDARGKGIDTRPIAAWCERALDGGRTAMTRDDLARLRTAARSPASRPTTEAGERRRRALELKGRLQREQRAQEMRDRLQRYGSTKADGADAVAARRAAALQRKAALARAALAEPVRTVTPAAAMALADSLLRW